MNEAKRLTLKRLATVAVATTGSGVASKALAGSSVFTASSSTINNEADVDLSSFEVYARVSSVTNDIEVVIKNVGTQPARITRITPSQTETRRGTFDFAKLLKNKELHVAAGDSVSVPMQPHAVSLDASTSAQRRATSLTAALRRSFSVTTDNEAFAKVDVVKGLRFV